MTRGDGFSLVEALFAMAIAMAVMGSALRLALPTESMAASRSETADMQQRIRVAADALSQRLGDAGAAAYSSMAPGPVTDTTAAVFPYRTGVSASDPPGSFRRDAITVLSVPRNGAEPVGTTFWLKREDATATYQLIAVESANGVDVPVVDNVVALAFEYFGDPQPPMMRKPLADPIGPWTTYGPKPSLAAVVPFAAGENCVFLDDGSATPQPRLAALDSAGAALVTLTASQLTDGPWCPDGAAPDRWDADLLRIRSIGITVRVQAAAAALRGPAGPLFVHGGTSRGGHQWVPDLEIRFQVSPRNLNANR